MPRQRLRLQTTTKLQGIVLTSLQSSGGAESERGDVCSTYLFRNCSRPCLLSSMKESSNIPSSPLNGSWRIRALPGRGGTTTWDKKEQLNINRRFIEYLRKTFFINSQTKKSDVRTIKSKMFKRILQLSTKYIADAIGVVSLVEETRTQSPLWLTLLSRSSSALSHSKSLYLLRTLDSFSLKMGRLVCGHKKATMRVSIERQAWSFFCFCLMHDSNNQSPELLQHFDWNLQH